MSGVIGLLRANQVTKGCIPRSDSQDRVVSDEYLRGFRRLAETAQDASAGTECWRCKNAIGFVTWHCELVGKCNFQPCYSRDSLTEADIEAGENLTKGWAPLPPSEGSLK